MLEVEKMDITKLLSAMTLEEKASLCSGLDFWHLKGIEHLNIPSIMVADGPHGLRKQEDSSDHLGIYESNPSTCFPTAVGMASSWNRELIEKVGIDRKSTRLNSSHVATSYAVSCLKQQTG